MKPEESQVQDVKEEQAEQQGEKDVAVDNVPYGRFKEVIKEKNSMKAELETLKTQVFKEAEERKLKEMEAKGEYESALEMVRQESLKKDDVIAKQNEELSGFRTQYDTERDSLLTQLSDEDKAVYGGLTNAQLQAHINKNKSNNIPSVDNSMPDSTQGYRNLVDAARDFQKGNIDESIYNRIKNAFRANQA